MFARGSGLTLTDRDNDLGNEPVLIRGMGKRKLIWQRWREQQPFCYMDSGYIGNYPSTANPQGWKKWHRIVPNDLQHTKIIERPDDRWRQLNYPIRPRSKGKHILVVLPSEKPCKFYGIDLEQWRSNTLKNIAELTDRPIRVREKQDRKQRVNSTIFENLDDCHCVITYQSVAAVECVLYGVPAITLAPCAADPVSEKHIHNIEEPHWPDNDTRHKWAHSLAYGQYHIQELQDGTAYALLKNEIS